MEFPESHLPHHKSYPDTHTQCKMQHSETTHDKNKSWCGNVDAKVQSRIQNFNATVASLSSEESETCKQNSIQQWPKVVFMRRFRPTGTRKNIFSWIDHVHGNPLIAPPVVNNVVQSNKRIRNIYIYIYIYIYIKVQQQLCL